jgi:hypothetical protein
MDIYSESTVNAILSLIRTKYRNNKIQNRIEKFFNNVWIQCDFYQEMTQFIDEHYDRLPEDEINQTILELESRLLTL